MALETKTFDIAEHLETPKNIRAFLQGSIRNRR